MREVVLQIPSLEAKQNIEIDVKINGKKRTLKYRVEIIEMESSETGAEERVDILRRVIREYDKNWELINIGAPSDTNIPIMFREKSVMAVNQK